MNSFQPAIDEIRTHIATQPIEPFQDLSRRPGRYRETAEYRNWETESRHWHKTLGALTEKGLHLSVASDRTYIRWHDTPIPGTIFRRNPDGTISSDRGRMTQRLLIPGPKQNLQNFLRDHRNHQRHNQRWDADTQIYGFLAGYRITLTTEAKGWTNDRIRQVEYAWIQAIRDLLDPELQRRLRRVTGPGIKLTLRHYNLAAAAGGALLAVHRTNPGAASWYINHPNSPAAGRPGEIIAAVRRQFADHGGRHWKMLATQPSGHTGVLMDRYGPAGAVFIVNAIGDVPIPRLPAQKTPSGAEPTPQTPTPARYRQPPLPLKLALLHACRKPLFNGYDYDRSYRIYRPGGHDAQIVETGWQNLARLAIRQLGQQPNREQNNKENRQHFADILTDLADFVLGDPQRAGRCASWSGLQKASREWHRDAPLRAIAAQAAVDRRNETAMSVSWDSVIQNLQADGWRARALVSYQDLCAESAVMNHCIGSTAFAAKCQEGWSRVFHLQPDGIADDDEASQRRHATTLEMELVGYRWQIRQQRGYRNRKATAHETQQAKQLLKHWQQAVATTSVHAPGS